MRAWLAYAAVSGVVVLLLALLVVALLDPSDRLAVWLAAGIAYAVQLVAFLGLVVVGRGPGFLIGWAAGMLLRLAVIVGLALLLRRSEAVDPATALVSLVGFVFVLVLVEPIFLRLAE